MSVLQPVPSMRHLEVGRYPLCPISLTEPPGNVLRRVSPVIIDTLGGAFPFLLFRLRHAASGLIVYCIRGSASFPSEQAIERLYAESLSAHFLVDVQGGGSIHFADTTVQIQGSSSAYGRADHHLVGKLVKFCFPQHKVQYEPPLSVRQQMVLEEVNRLLKKEQKQRLRPSIG